MPATRAKKGASVHVALLRGINLGNNNKVPMKALAAMFEDAGCSDVQTYIQSGNVVFSAAETLARRIASIVEDGLAKAFGYKVPVVTRSASELIAIAEGNPFLKEGGDADVQYVAFLRERPSASRLATLDPARSPPDSFTVVGREIYLQCPNGLARTKLTNQYFDSRLETVSTVRNWRTVLKLLEMTGAAR